MRALDVAAGWGRISYAVLIHFFRFVDIMEKSKAMVTKAKRYREMSVVEAGDELIGVIRNVWEFDLN